MAPQEESSGILAMSAKTEGIVWSCIQQLGKYLTAVSNGEVRVTGLFRKGCQRARRKTTQGSAAYEITLIVGLARCPPTGTTGSGRSSLKAHI